MPPAPEPGTVSPRKPAPNNTLVNNRRLSYQRSALAEGAVWHSRLIKHVGKVFKCLGEMCLVQTVADNFLASPFGESVDLLDTFLYLPGFSGAGTPLGPWRRGGLAFPFGHCGGQWLSTSAASPPPSSRNSPVVQALPLPYSWFDWDPKPCSAAAETHIG